MIIVDLTVAETRIDLIGIVTVTAFEIKLGAVAAIQRVVAVAAVKFVVAAPAIKEVIVVAPVDDIVERIAVGVVGGTRQGDVFDELRQVIPDRRDNGIVAAGVGLAVIFDDLIKIVVNKVGIVAGATMHDVLTAAAVEDIVAVIAIQGIGKRIAGGGEIGNAGQGQDVEIVIQRVVDAGENGIRAVVGAFQDRGAGAVDIIGVGAGTALQDILAGRKVEPVRAEHVGTRCTDDQQIVAMIEGGAKLEGLCRRI